MLITCGYIFKIINSGNKRKHGNNKFNYFMIKSLNGDGGKTIDILESHYFIKNNDVDIVNMSCSINNKLYKYLLKGLISKKTKYFFALNNYENTDSLYIRSNNIIYVYDKEQLSLNYIKRLDCNNIVIYMSKSYNR